MLKFIESLLTTKRERELEKQNAELRKALVETCRELADARFALERAMERGVQA